MKRLISVLLCIPLMLFQTGCSKHVDKNESGDELYTQVLELSNLYINMIPDLSSVDAIATKNESDTGWESFVELPQDIQSMFIDYMSPEDICNWDELSFCSQLSNMQSITDDNKNAVIHGLAACMALKSFANDSFVTKGGHPEADCRSAYYHKVKMTLLGVVGATVAGLAGGLLGSEAACVAALSIAIKEINDAGEEYVRCWA